MLWKAKPTLDVNVHHISQSRAHTRIWIPTFSVYHTRNKSQKHLCTAHIFAQGISAENCKELSSARGWAFQLSWSRDPESPLEDRDVPFAQPRRIWLSFRKKAVSWWCSYEYQWLAFIPYRFKWL